MESYREALATLERELDERIEHFEPELPERAEPDDPPDVDERDVLFDWRRDWLDQHERYRRQPLQLDDDGDQPFEE